VGANGGTGMYPVGGMLGLYGASRSWTSSRRSRASSRRTTATSG
jgi:hypothetical protein